MKIDGILQPMSAHATQTYLGRGLHTLGLIEWLLRQTGPAEIVLSTFSTSVEFLSGFFNLRKCGLVRSAILVADLKASKKTYRLDALMRSCFDHIYLAENHSKVVLLKGGRFNVSVISSQNNTYGGRAECTLVTTNRDVLDALEQGLHQVITNSLIINGQKN